MQKQKDSRQPLLPEQVARLQRLAASKGVCQAARFVGVAVNTFDRARGGLPLQPGTCLLIGAAIAKRDQEGKDP
jgi:hypothetical protein